MSEDIVAYARASEDASFGLFVELCSSLASSDGTIPWLEQRRFGSTDAVLDEKNALVANLSRRLSVPVSDDLFCAGLGYQPPFGERLSLYPQVRGAGMVAKARGYATFLEVAVSEHILTPRLALPSWVWSDSALAGEVFLHASQLNVEAFLGLLVGLSSTAGLHQVLLGDDGKMPSLRESWAAWVTDLTELALPNSQPVSADVVALFQRLSPSPGVTSALESQGGGEIRTVPMTVLEAQRQQSTAIIAPGPDRRGWLVVPPYGLRVGNVLDAMSELTA